MTDIIHTARHTTDAKLGTWPARCVMATADLPSDDRAIVLMLLCAVLGAATGPLRSPRFGANAIIKKGPPPALWTQYTSYLGESAGPIKVLTVDQLNRYLGWLVKAIDATDDEYQAIVNKFASWISRDETQIGLHVERQRANLDKSPDLSGVMEDVAKADAARAQRKLEGKE